MFKKKRLKGWTMFDTIVTLIAFIIILITLYPMLYVISCSFSDPYEVLAGRVYLLPKGFTLKAYEIVGMDMKYWKSVSVTVLYVVLACLLMLTTTVLVAYPLTRPNLKFRKILNYYLLIPMFVSGGMIPSFIVMTKYGLFNTIWAVLLPGCSIMNIILCRTYMASVSKELIESAMLDGCRQFQTLIKIMLPLSKPILAVISIYTIVGQWNSWFGASIYLTNKDFWPVQLYLKQVLEALYVTKEFLAKLPYEERLRYEEMANSANQIRYAMITLTVLPIIMVYPFFQKHFAKGIMLGSLKG